MGKKDKKINRELLQLLLNVVIIGLFSMVENWLLFYYSCSWVLPGIFGLLKLMVCCLFVINVYDLIKAPARSSEADRDRQVQMLLYKQMKKLDEGTEEAIAELRENMNQQMEELKKEQLRAAKAVWNKLDGLSSEN